MEVRKLIKFGNSSYVVSVPKKWLKRNKLGKGDLLYATENGTGELVFSPSDRKKEKEIKEIEIKTDGKGLIALQREIIAGYIAGCDVFNIYGRDFKDKVKDIKIILSNLIALEVMEQTSDRIIAKNFIKFEDISLKKTVRRIDMIVRSMLSDSKNCFKEDLYEDIYERDYDVNKLSFLMYRVVKVSLDDPEAMNYFGLTNSDLLNFWSLIINLEKVGDEAKRIARCIRTLNTKSNKLKELINLYSLIEKDYLNVMNAYYIKDKNLAYNIADKKDSVIKLCNDYLSKNNVNPEVSLIVEKLKAVEIFIRDIARIVYCT